MVFVRYFGTGQRTNLEAAAPLPDSRGYLPDIYQQICCHNQDDDEAWRSHFFRIWTYCVEQFTI